MISHQGGKTRYCGPFCGNCHERPVGLPGALCLPCREQHIYMMEMERDRRIMGAIVAIFLAVALLVIGFISAHGTWVRMK